MNSKAIGIDLGTTYSCVGVFQHNKVDIIANDQGNRTTPSYVSFNETERLIGDAAKSQSSLYPENTIFDVKRLIGRKYDEPAVQKDLKNWPFRVVPDQQGNPRIKITFGGETKYFTPEEISAMILSKMKETAQSAMGESVITDTAVITVPAYFNDSQRLATKDAAKIAGLNVLRIINEPTAAALAYGFIKKEENTNEKKILIFDLGGGTFDVSILEVDSGVYEVKSTSGDTHLGGEDFDTRLVDYCLREFRRKNSRALSSVVGEFPKRTIRRMRTACERSKRVLSSTNQTTIEIDSLYEGIDFHCTITRARFEDLCKDLFHATLKPVEKALSDANLSKSEINEIVLVGGSTRIPYVRHILAQYFNGKQLNYSINPDEAVAYGAAVQAAILSNSGENNKILNDMLLIDVIPLTLGIEITNQRMAPIIPRNTSIPHNASKTFTTFTDNQTSVLIKVYEGERVKIVDNHFLGQFELAGIAPAPKGTPEIEVTFDLNSDGILNVTSCEKKSGKRETIRIEKSRLTQKEIERMIEDSIKFKEKDDQYQKLVTKRNELQNKIFAWQSNIKNQSSSNIQTSSFLDECEKSLVALDNITDTDQIDSIDRNLEQLYKNVLKNTTTTANENVNNTINIEEVD